MTRASLQYYRASGWVLIVGLLLACVVGYYYTGSIPGTAEMVMTAAILAVLEISLSFDNAIINATVLGDMEETWVRRFLTWGMAISVFGMRFVFPIVMVSALAAITPWAALDLALTRPDDYARVLTSAHVSVAGFGGAFLMMVGLGHFFGEDKELHWVHSIEAPLQRMGGIMFVDAAIVMALSLIFAGMLLGSHHGSPTSFMIASAAGVLTQISVHKFAEAMKASNDRKQAAKAISASAAKGGFGMFMYLNVLDASFSFDGVIGAFALTTNLLIISIGLGIGAMFVRSMTVMLVKEGTLGKFRYLETGAFYAILSLGFIMFLSTAYEVPEAVTGLIGAVIIGLSVHSSVKAERAETLA